MASSESPQMLSQRVTEVFARMSQAGSNAHSDVTVRGVIGDDITTGSAAVEYKRHKGILSQQSTWFAAACRNHAFQEGITGVITIPMTRELEFNEDADDFEAFGRMMHFFYHPEYLRSDDDPLSDDILLLHAKVYGLAEKYDVTGLREASRKCFSESLDLHWTSGKLSSVIRMVNQSVAPEVDGLKQIMANKVAEKMGDLIQKTDFQEAITEFRDFSIITMKTLDGLKPRESPEGGLFPIPPTQCSNADSQSGSKKSFRSKVGGSLSGRIAFVITMATYDVWLVARLWSRFRDIRS